MPLTFIGLFYHDKIVCIYFFIKIANNADHLVTVKISKSGMNWLPDRNVVCIPDRILSKCAQNTNLHNDFASPKNVHKASLGESNIIFQNEELKG